MGWLQQLVKTYDACAGAPQFKNNPLAPISHTPQQAHLEIVLDGSGKFLRARILQKEETLIPATEKSANRVGIMPPPHPLCDKLQYVAADYPTAGGAKPSFHVEYLALLGQWCASQHFADTKAKAVLRYVERGSVIADLVREKLIHLDPDGKLLTEWKDGTIKPEIFRLLPGAKGEQDQGNAFVRWSVETPGDRYPQVWLDPQLQRSWIAFNSSQMQWKGLCMATGETDVALTASHPKRLRHPADGAKLISSNDASGFTFRGRFTDNTGDQACGISYDASQKAHLALRWLIGRQAFRNGDQVVVSWAVQGEPIPDPLTDTYALIDMDISPGQTAYRGDGGQFYAQTLKKKLAGYRAQISPATNIIIMALDAATKGRMAISFYREFGGAEFLDRIEAWHTNFAWHQNFGKERKFTGAPAPRDIIDAAYGARADERLRKACVERLLPCILDGQALPRDLVDSTCRRATRRIGLEKWEWEKTLGIACALFRGYQLQHQQGDYGMALEPDRTTRDYLFGRLLALAEHLEKRALFYAGEERDTHAAKMMQRYADHPCATWRQIELALTSSKSRMRSRSPGYLHQLEQQIDAITCMFQPGDFTDDRKLTGEFLLGYHCQRAPLNEPKEKAVSADNNTENETGITA